MRLTESQFEGLQGHLAHCPTFESRPWVEGPPVSQRRVAIIATSGVHMPNDRPFQYGVRETYRVIPGNIQADDLTMSHGETTFDRIGFQQDSNMLFPIDRLRELVSEGVIGSLADFHYSFGAPMSDEDTEAAAREIAGLLKRDKVDAALMCAPV
jgi:D-proline reductase (dithiol) PrdB